MNTMETLIAIGFEVETHPCWLYIRHKLSNMDVYVSIPTGFILVVIRVIFCTGSSYYVPVGITDKLPMLPQILMLVKILLSMFMSVSTRDYGFHPL